MLDAKQFAQLVKEIKSNKFVKEQQAISQYVDYRCGKLMEEFLSCKDDFERIQGALRELKDLKRVLGDING